MKRLLCTAIIMIMIICNAAGAEMVPEMDELFSLPTATPAPDAFRFRDGIRWGMNQQQVQALESEKMTERIMQSWSVMLTDEKVAVSRFTADLVFMFRENRLMMISYEFQRQTVRDDFNYLSEALSSLYGEKKEAESLKIKALMDLINPNRYKTEMIKNGVNWTSKDGTTIYLYYYTTDSFAITYVSPELGARIYQTNGL